MIVSRNVIIDLQSKGWRIAGYSNSDQDIGIAKYIMHRRFGDLDRQMITQRMPNGDINVIPLPKYRKLPFQEF